MRMHQKFLVELSERASVTYEKGRRSVMRAGKHSANGKVARLSWPVCPRQRTALVDMFKRSAGFPSNSGSSVIAASDDK